MNANEICPKSNNTRLNRIKTASRVFRLFNGICFIMGIYWVLGFLFGWPFLYQGQVRIVISRNHIYTSPADMPQAILAFWMVKTGLAIFCMVVFNNLFRLYEQGILFSAKNVRYLRFQGYFLIITWGIDYRLQSIERDMALSTTPVFVGLLIIFIAWIMDEGRKIQEEQELTV